MTGLRLTREGVSEAEFRTRFGRGLAETYSKEIRDLLDSDLLEKFVSAGDSEGFRLTKRGRLLGNRVFARFV